MRYQISGKQIDIGEALQSHVKTELGETLGKYAGRPTDAVVIFSKSGPEFVCETVVHLSTGLTAQAKSHAHEIYAAFDGCCEKMDKQLRRYKRRLKDHHSERTTPVELMASSSYILAATEESEDESEAAVTPAANETAPSELIVSAPVPISCAPVKVTPFDPALTVTMFFSNPTISWSVALKSPFKIFEVPGIVASANKFILNGEPPEPFLTLSIFPISIH